MDWFMGGLERILDLVFDPLCSVLGRGLFKRIPALLLLVLVILAGVALRRALRESKTAKAVIPLLALVPGLFAFLFSYLVEDRTTVPDFHFNVCICLLFGLALLQAVLLFRKPEPHRIGRRASAIIGGFAAFFCAVALYLFSIEINVWRADMTEADMRCLGTAMSAYHFDHDVYPVTSSLDVLRAQLVPTYLPKMLERDAWGTPFFLHSVQKGFVLASAGRDRSFDRDWSHCVSGCDMRENGWNFDADCMMFNEGFTEYWSLGSGGGGNSQSAQKLFRKTAR